MQASDILKKIEQNIQEANLHEKLDEKWQVLEVRDWVATVSWLNNAKFSEIVKFETGDNGLVLDILPNQIWVLILGEASKITVWSFVQSTWEILSVNVWDEYLWRVVDGLGNIIDWWTEPKTSTRYNVERIAPWVMSRKSVDQPLETWIKAIDSMIAIWKGQRELIIWDRQTWKTTIAIDTILNQKGRDVKCIYVAIGQKDSKVRRIVELLKERGAMDYTIVVNASASSSAVEQYLAPYVGCSLAEYFLYNGQDALIVYDDLSKHAVAYREVSLLLRRPPGREAYPWDVFYLHSRLLERSARVNEDFWGWSMTALPIIETQAWDVSAYIPTNVISITDGQVALDTDLFNSGTRPAINVWLSVSRVGWSAQTKIMKKVAWKLKLELASFRELAAFMQFSSDLDESTQKKIETWKRLTELLKQPNNRPISFEKQVVVIYAGINWYLDSLPVEKIKEFETTLYSVMDKSGLGKEIIDEKNLSENIEANVKRDIEETIRLIK